MTDKPVPVSDRDRGLAIWNQWRGYSLDDHLREPFIEFAAKVIQSAALSRWQRCPVSKGEHEWIGPTRYFSHTAPGRCIRCEVLRSAITPAEAGSAEGSG